MGEVEDLDGMTFELGCKFDILASNYLGLPLGAPHNISSGWNWVEERFRKKLALWKRQYISKGGRLTLIKGTLSKMPIHMMSLFRMPKKVKVGFEKSKEIFYEEEATQTGEFM